MRAIKLIKKLKKEGKIKIVEASEEVSKSYFLKSKNCLKAAKILSSQKLFEESISMSYYSMYNKVQGLFFLTGFKCENHSIAIFLLKEIFELENENILLAKKERIDKQYYIDFKITSKNTKELIYKTEEFNENLDSFMERLGERDIDSYKNKFIKMLE